jgi:hypothetical protein
MSKIRHYENLHIPLWLLKDTCWMMQWKVLGIIMIFPTLFVAIYLAAKTWRQGGDEFWVNLAICLWIVANSFWMCCEFFNHEELKNYAGIPFILGMLSVVVFYILRYLNKRKKDFL